MIGTDEMSSTTGMDISESFRPEDLSKTDFFDFVTAPDMGIGVGVSLHSHHHSHERTSASSMTHDGGGGGADGRCGGGSGGGNHNNSNTSDPTLQGYEFWHTDKEHSRLESTIFEDLDRYCWQQQQATTLPHHTHHSPATHSANPTSPPHHQLGVNAAASSSSATASSSSVACNNSSSSVHTASSSGGGGGSISQPSSAGTVSSIENTDGQIYTITVLNGNEPWMKREPDTQLPSTLDLDSLLGNFPGYIKSEYPYDDSGFSTDGTKDVNGGDAANVISSIPQVAPHHKFSAVASGGQSLPSFATAISAASGSTSTTNIGQQLAQFQNNNNDWHMADHNSEQNSAESLLRSALQGKGYSKGLHMQNGITLVPSSPSVKDDDMRRILFPPDADSLAFADSTLNTAQIFEDAQNAAHNAHMATLQQHSPGPNGGGGGPLATTNHHPNTGGVSSIIVDDMFLSLENAFNDDFEKIKRIANEVQQFCSSATPNVGDYAGSGSGDIMMQMSPSTTQQQQLQHLHSPAPPPPSTTTTTSTIGGGGLPPPLHMQSQALSVPSLKSEVITSTASTAAATTVTTSAVAAATGRITAGKSTKKYKRPSAVAGAAAHSNNNNNPNVMNHNNSNNNNNNNNNVSGGSAIGAASTTNNNNTSSGSSSSNSSNSPTHCNNGQRKERSLHYCSMCSKGFKDKYSVNVHIRTHTGEKPFACSLCGKSFRQKAHLAKHYQTHMAQKNNGGSNGIVKAGGGGGGSGGGGSSAGKHRSSATSGTSTTVGSSVVAPHRQLSIVGVTSLSNLGNSIGVGIGAGMPTLNGPMPTTTATILPPANGLLANR